MLLQASRIVTLESLSCPCLNFFWFLYGYFECRFFYFRYISESYFLQNPEEAEKVFGCEDACEFAAGAIVFINTSMNNNNVKDKMTEDDFASYGQCKQTRLSESKCFEAFYEAALYRDYS